MNQIAQDTDGRSSSIAKTAGRKRDKGSASPVAGLLPQLAVNLAADRAQRVTQALSTAADSVDLLVNNDLLPLSDGLRALAHSASEQLREVAERANPDHVGVLAMRVQLAAARNPALAAAIGAALGGVLGLALSRLGKNDDHADRSID